MTALLRGALADAAAATDRTARRSAAGEAPANAAASASAPADSVAINQQLQAELRASQDHAARLAERIQVLDVAAAEASGLDAALEATRAELQVVLRNLGSLLVSLLKQGLSTEFRSQPAVVGIEHACGSISLVSSTPSPWRAC